MALTQEDKNELLNAIKAESQSVDELTEVDSLDGVNSLPAMRGTEVVECSGKLIKQAGDGRSLRSYGSGNDGKEGSSDGDGGGR